MSDEYYATASTDRYQVLKEYARKNRVATTDAEAILWEYLRAGRMGVKFRRQHPVLDFIADFICLSERLIIEVDGGYHNTEYQLEKDEIRDDRLHSMSYRILRYTNEQVIYETETVLEDIKYNIKNILKYDEQNK